MKNTLKSKTFLVWTILCVTIVIVTFIAIIYDKQHHDINIKTAYYVIAGLPVLILLLIVEQNTIVKFLVSDNIIYILFVIQWLIIWYSGWVIHKKNNSYTGFYILFGLLCFGLSALVEVFYL